MGLEFINQPQVFTQGITALGGIQGVSENYPLLTTYYSWTSTSSVETSTFPIPLDLGVMLQFPESFLVTVGGVLQPPTTYSIDINNRQIIFTSPVSADIEVAATQLATASPSSQSFDFVKSNTASFTNLSSVSAVIDDLTVGANFEPPNLYILGNGQLGIGLTDLDTQTRFHIKAPENDQIMITNNATPSGSWRLNVSDIDNSFYVFDFDNNKVPFTVVKDSPADSLYLGLSGVGINTTSPNTQLTVVGNISGTGNITTNSVRTNTLTGVDAFFTGTRVGVGTNNPVTIFESRGGTSTFTANNNERSIAARYSTTGGSVHFGAASDSATPNAVISNAGSTAIATFANSGNVGIGNTNPAARLTIGSNLGGSAPSTLLTINAGALGGTAGNTLNLANFGFTSNNVTSLGLKARRQSNGSDWTTSAIGLLFDVDNTSPVNNSEIWMTGNGNIGIGTNTPSTKLHVAGDLTVTGNVNCPEVEKFIRMNSNGVQFSGGITNFGSYSQYYPTNMRPVLLASSYYELEFGMYFDLNNTTSADVDIQTALSGTSLFSVPYGYCVHAFDSSGATTGVTGIITPQAIYKQNNVTTTSVIEFDSFDTGGSGTSARPIFAKIIYFVQTTTPVTLNLISRIRSEGTSASTATLLPLANSYIKIKQITRFV
jgi:hypothetical protein